MLLDAVEQPAEVPEDPAAPADPRALRLYASARLQLLDGKAAAALVDLELAAKFDPSSAEIQREIAEAQLSLGRRAAAAQSYQRAVSLGLREPRAFGVLGREALRANRRAEAIKFLTWALSLDANVDPAFASVACIDLAEALLAEGYIAASRDALEEGLSALTPPSSASRSIADATDVFRRRGELWLLSGDLSCRLGEPDRAVVAYVQAGGAPNVEPIDILARRVHLDLLAGRSARASLVLLEALIDSDGRIDDRTLPVLTFIAQQTRAGEALSRAVGDLSRTLGPSASSTTLGRLARATAASLPASQARQILRDRLRDASRDTETIIDLLALCNSTNSQVRELLDLAGSAPNSIDRLADAAISLGRDLDDTIRLLESNRTPEALVLRATLLTKLGSYADALNALDAAAPSGPIRPAFLAVRAGAAAASGNNDLQAQTLAQFDALVREDPTADVRRAAAAAYLGAQQPRPAFDVLAPALAPAEHPDAELLLEGADLALAAGMPDRSEPLLRRAMDADRFDERVYDSLLALFAPGGAIPDDRKFTDAARALRQAAPSSRLIRVLTAQEQIARSLWPQAESQLLSLMDANRESSQALSLLVTVWERSAESSPELAERGEAWLRARLSNRAQAPGLLMALARVVTARGRPAEAEELLVPRLERWPMPDMARLREWIVRSGLDEPARADQLALQRLEREPRTFDNRVELAELHVRHADLVPAASALEDALTPDSTLSEPQARRLLNLLSGLRSDKVQNAGAESTDAAIRMFDLVAARGVPMSPQLHLARLALLAAGQPDETATIVNAIRSMGERYPDLRLTACAQVLELLAARDSAAPALLFLPAAAALFSPPNEQLLFEWLRLTAVRGDAADIDRFLRDSNPKLMLEVLSRTGSDVILPDDPAEFHLALTEVLAGMLSSLDRVDLAIATYRKVLEVEPKRSMTCNDLGYLLLENGGDLDECDRLITIAHEGEPEEFHVTDSLGWVRYKRGVLTDQTDEQGKVIVEGAVTLLHRAVEQQGGDASWAILDHYGDALWRVSRTAEARDQWNRAKAAIEEQIKFLDLGRRPDAAPDAPGLVRLRTALESIRRKLADAAASREPAVAPLANAKEP